MYAALLLPLYSSNPFAFASNGTLNIAFTMMQTTFGAGVAAWGDGEMKTVRRT